MAVTIFYQPVYSYSHSEDYASKYLFKSRGEAINQGNLYMKEDDDCTSVKIKELKYTEL